MAVQVAEKLVVLDPTIAPTPTPTTLAPRLTDLNGKVVGLLDNSKMNSDRFLEHTVAILGEKYRFAAVLRKRKPSASKLAPPEIMEEFVEKCDLVITAVGD